MQITEAALRSMKPKEVRRLLEDARRQGNQVLVNQLQEYLKKIEPSRSEQESEAGQWYWLPAGAGQGQWLWIPSNGGVPLPGPATPGVSQQPFIPGVPTIPQPTAPPAGATGAGAWQWLSQQEDEGQWTWIPEGSGTIIGGPATSDEAIIAPIGQTGAPVLAPPTGVPTPPAGGPPGVPTPPAGGPPSTPGGSGGGQPIGPAIRPVASDKTAARILPPLTAAQLGGLTQQEKDVSDKMISDALKKIAHEVFVKAENVPKKTKVLFGQKQKELDTPFLGYQWYIKEALIQTVGMNAQFKKRQELIDLLGEDDAPGALFQFIDQALKKADGESLEQFLLRIKNNLDQYTATMLALFDTCAFITPQFDQLVTDDIRTTVINTAITQRPAVKVVVRTVRGAQKEEDDPTPIQTALNTRTVVDMLRSYIGELHAASRRLRQANDALRDSHGRLMVLVLRDKLNLLRLNPHFYCFNRLLGSAQRAIAASKSGVEQSSNLPLLDVLDVFDEKYLIHLNAKAIKSAINGTLFFTISEAQESLGLLLNAAVRSKPLPVAPTAESWEKDRYQRELEQWQAIRDQLGLTDAQVNEIVSNNELFDKAVNDYAVEIRQVRLARKQAVDVYEVINEPLKNVLQYDEIKGVLETLKQVAGTPDRNKIIDALIKELDHPEFTPNVNQIINGLKQLSGRQQVDFETNVRTRIDSFIKQNENTSKILRILRDAVQSYDRSKRPVGAELIRALEKELPLGRFKDQIKGVKSTAHSIYEALISLTRKRTAISNIVKEDKFYKMIEPYGLLMMILDGWAQKVSGKPAEEQLELLYNSLELLNSPDKKFSDTTPYAEGLVEAGLTQEKNLADYKPLVYSRVYAGTLTEIIKHLKAFQFDQVKNEIRKLVATSGVGAEQDPDFDAIVTRFQQTFAQLFFISIVDQLKELNSGESMIEGLPVRDYVDFYVALKDQLTPLLNILAPRGNPLDDLSKLTVPQVQQELDAFQASMQRIIGTLDLDNSKKKHADAQVARYIGWLKGIFGNLQRFAPTQAAALIPQVPSGIPQPPTNGPPVPAGGPPPVPSTQPPRVPGS